MVAVREGHEELRKVLEKREFEGVPFRVLDREIQEGDTYLAARNTGPHLLTAEKVLVSLGWVVPVEVAYAFDITECVPIELLGE